MPGAFISILLTFLFKVLMVPFPSTAFPKPSTTRFKKNQPLFEIDAIFPVRFTLSPIPKQLSVASIKTDMMFVNKDITKPLVLATPGNFTSSPADTFFNEVINATPSVMLKIKPVFFHFFFFFSGIPKR
jgi:hypothetical protein